MNIDQIHASAQCMRRRFPHELHRQPLHPFNPVLASGHLGDVPRLLQVVLVDDHLGSFRWWRVLRCFVGVPKCTVSSYGDGDASATHNKS